MTWAISEYATEQEWLDARRRAITSSDVPTILGVSPYSNPFQLWIEKTGGQGPRDDAKMRRRFRMGHHVEPLIAEWFAEDTGRSPFRPAPGYYLLTNPGLSWAAVTPDLLVIDGRGPDGVVEGKSAGLMDLSGYEQSPALHYAVAQLHLPLLVCGMEQGWVATTFGMANAFKVYPTERNPELSDLIVERCSAFYRLIVEKEPPGEDFLRSGAEIGKALARIFSQETGETIELEGHFAEKAIRLEAARELKKGAEAEIEELTNEIKLRMGACTFGRIPGYARLVQWRKETKKAHVVAESTTRVLRFVKDGKGKL